MLSNKVATFNAQVQLRVDKDTWPPGQSYNFRPLLLVYVQITMSIMKDNRGWIKLLKLLN